MIRFIPLLALVLIGAGVAFGQVPDADKQKIVDNAPAKAIVKPKQDRRILVFSRTTGFRHGSIAWGVHALQVIGDKTGAWATDATEDPAVFTAENLKKYDCIVFLNTTGDPVPDANARKAVEDFVASGKSIAGIHAATDTGYNWPEYGKMMGGYFDGHPWNAGHNVTIRIEDPDHAINKAAFADGTFQHKDEIYQYRTQPYSRQKLRVLMSLDLAGPNMKAGGMKRDDNDYAVAWVNTYGKGRVYYNNLGHNNHTYWHPDILEHFLAGIQFACGDLEADTTPSAQADKARAQSRVAELLPKIAAYKVGDDRAPLTEVEDTVNAVADTDAADELAAQLATLAADDSATDKSRQWALRQLAVIGTAKNVPAIAPLLTHERLAHMARNALLHIDGDEAAAALRDALGKTTGDLRIGMIQTVGQRGDEKAQGALTKLAEDADEATAAAAINALGKIGALDALLPLTKKAPNARKAAVYAAALDAAEARKGDRAKDLYQALMAPGMPDHLRIAGLKGLVRVAENPGKRLREQVAGDDPMLKIAAIRLMQDAEGPEVTKQMVGALAGADATTQRVLIEALADRGDTGAAGPVAHIAMNTRDAEVRLAAVQALRRIGDADAVPVLAKLAATTTGSERTEIRQALADAPGAKVNDALVRHAAAADDSGVQEELVRALGERRAYDALVKLVTDDKLSPPSRAQALRALADHASGLPGPTAAAQMRTLMTLAKGNDEKKMLLAALSRVGDAQALELAESYKGDAELKGAAEQAAARIAKALEGPPVATASHGNDKTANALDGNAGSRWDSGTQMRPGMWFMLDLKKPRTVRKLTLDTRGSANDFPQGWELYIGDDPSDLGKPVATGAGSGPVTEIDAKNTKGRFIKIVQTGSSNSWFWSIHELSVDME